MSNAVEFNSLTANDEVKVKMDPPARVSQKPSDEEVAKYSKTRLVLVVLFGILIIGMVVAAVVIIIVSPKCPPKKAPIDREWFKDDIAYQINLKNFKDSNGDGNGDLKGLTESLDYLDGLGVKILRLNSIFQSPNQNNDIQDYMVIDPIFGNMSDFEELVKKAHEKGMKIIVDFVPNHTSKQHQWFVESAKSTNSDKRGWYVWRKEKNNWPSVTGGSAWEKDSTTNEYYLHQFEVDKPDLNLRNDSVVEELKNVLRFWMKKGVDGFTARDVQYLLENSTFSNEVQKPNYSSNKTTYDMTEHSQTFGLAGNVELVKKFRDTLNEADSHKLFILDLKGTPAQVAQFYNQSDIPSFTGLIGLKKPADINRTITEYLKSLKKGQWPNFVVSDCKTDFKSLTNAMNVLLLTLPGTPSSCVGMELGTNKVDWKEAEKQEKDKKSTYNVYKTVAELRKKPGFNTTDFKCVQAGSQVLGYVRGNKYLVAINFDEKKWNTDNFKGLSGTGTVKFDSKFVLNGKTVDINRDVVLEGGQAVIIESDHFKFM